MSLSQAAQDAIAIRRYEIDDPVRQAKLDEMLAEQGKLDDQLKSIREERAASDAALGQARSVASANEARKAELDRREEEIAQVSAALEAEKIAWEAVRQKVDREQAELKESLDQREGTLSAREVAADKREDGLTAREGLVAEGERIVAIKHGNLLSALQANEQIDPKQLYVAAGPVAEPTPVAMSVVEPTASSESHEES